MHLTIPATNQTKFVEGFIFACVEQVFETYYTKHSVNLPHYAWELVFKNNDEECVELFNVRFRNLDDAKVRIKKLILDTQENKNLEAFNVIEIAIVDYHF